MKRKDDKGKAASIRTEGIRLLSPETLLIGVAFLSAVLFSSCSRTSTSSYPRLEATLSLFAKQDSVALRYPVWAPSGLIYYVAYPKEGDSTKLIEYDPETADDRIVAESVRGPIAVAVDGKIACLETGYRLIVYDSTGAEVWAQNVGSTVSGLSFSYDGDTIYFCKNGSLLLISIGGGSPHDTLLEGIIGFSKSPDDSIIIYGRMTAGNGDSLYTFYRYNTVTGEQTLILQGGKPAGFTLNPASIDKLAVGMAAADEQLLPKQILLYHIDHGIGRIFSSSPYDLASLNVESWKPDGTILLITVTPYIEGDPPVPLPEEIWMVQDIY